MLKSCILRTVHIEPSVLLDLYSSMRSYIFYFCVHWILLEVTLNFFLNIASTAASDNFQLLFFFCFFHNFIYESEFHCSHRIIITKSTYFFRIIFIILLLLVYKLQKIPTKEIPNPITVIAIDKVNGYYSSEFSLCK